MSWTAERIELLNKLWAEGLTASQVASRIGGITRNAVIGKVHRMNLIRRGHSHNKPPKRRADPVDRIPKTRAPRKRIRIHESLKNLPPQTDAPVAGGIALMDLEAGQCRFAITPDNAGPSQHRFCGRKQVLGLSYCAHHAQVAYRPADPTPRRVYVPRSTVGIPRDVEAAKNVSEFVDA